MNRFILIVIISFSGILFTVHIVKAQSGINWAVQQLKQLSPSEYHVLYAYEQLPQKLTVKTDHETLVSYKADSTLKYMHGGDKLTSLADIATTVHELNHLLAREYPFEYCRIHNRSFYERSMYYFYFVGGEEKMVFSNVDYFPSSNLKNEIASEYQTFRYNPYIEGNLSTQ